MAKRERVRRYVAFGARLQHWRGKTPVELVLQRVRASGVPLSEATLRGWEYGWTGRPDPMRLLALAAVYGVTAAEAMDALRESREEVGGKPIGTDSLDAAISRPTKDVISVTDSEGTTVGQPQDVPSDPLGPAGMNDSPQQGRDAEPAHLEGVLDDAQPAESLKARAFEENARLTRAVFDIYDHARGTLIDLGYFRESDLPLRPEPKRRPRSSGGRREPPTS